jgi:hypothetical protein
VALQINATVLKEQVMTPEVNEEGRCFYEKGLVSHCQLNQGGQHNQQCIAVLFRLASFV